MFSNTLFQKQSIKEVVAEEQAEEAEEEEKAEEGEEEEEEGFLQWWKVYFLYF